MSQERIEKINSRLEQLILERKDWETTWRDIRDYIMPYHGRYLDSARQDSTQGKRGSRKDQKIINGLGGDASEVLAAGMMGGLTSPSRPWFSLGLADKGLMEIQTVKEWLDEVRRRMLNVFSRSNFYGTMYSTYHELGSFGVGAFLLEEDFETIIRARPFTIGEYFLSLDNKYRPDALYRLFTMTARQMQLEFGLNKCSDRVRTSITNGAPETRYEVVHVIMKNDEPDGSEGPKGMPYSSLYFESNAHEGRFLREGGYENIPFVAPRWKVNATDIYGTAPGWKGLGDIRMLQKMEEKKLKGMDKMVDPPMNAPLSLKGKNPTGIPGGINYHDVTQGTRGLEPSYLVKPDFQNIAFELQRVEERIQRFFYNDLFLSIMQAGKTMTATEVIERNEEKLLMLGPVLERLQSELLDPIIIRTFNIMRRFNRLPEIPEEIQGADLRVEYISLLAQAQKAIGITSIERASGYVASLAEINPEVIDKFDFDQSVDEYSEMLGVSPKIIRSDEVVANLRSARAEQQAQAQAQEQMPNAVKAAKQLAETVPEDDSLLNQFTGL